MNLYGGRIKLFLLNQNVLVVITRFIAVFGKFIAFFIVGKYMSTDIFASFILFTSSISILIYVLGLELYTYSVRLFLKENSLLERKKIFVHQFTFYCIVYVLFAVSLLLVSRSTLKIEYVYLFFIAILEHIGQEIYRILVALKKTILANFLLFLKSGCWVYILYILWEFKIIVPNITTLYLFWIISAFISFCIGILWILRYLRVFSLKDLSVNISWGWYKNSIKSVAIYFTIALILKTLEYGNRFITSYFLSSSDVAELGFIFQIAAPITIFIDAAVLSNVFPHILSATNSKDTMLIKSIISLNVKKILGIVFLSGVVLLVLFKYIIIFMNKSNLSTNYTTLFIAILIVLFQNLSSLFQIPIYGFSKDNSILIIYTISGLVFILLNIFLLQFLGILGIFMGSLLSFFLMMLLMYKKYISILNHYRF